MKTSTTDRPRTRKQEAAPSFIPQSWDDFTKLYPIYEALARQLELPGGPYPLGTKGGSWSDKKVRDRDLVWLDQMEESFISNVKNSHSEGLAIDVELKAMEGAMATIKRCTNKARQRLSWPRHSTSSNPA